MKTELKDVIHLYLGRECKLNNSEKIFKLIPSHIPSNYNEAKYNFKPILHRLEDMKEEHQKEYQNYFYNEQYETHIQSIFTSAKSTLFLFKNGYDVLGLIDSSQAIDAKTLNQQ